MKKIFLLCIAATLASCSTMLTPYSQNFSIYDFTPYTKEGFIITPAETGFAYQPVGDISVEFVPGYKKGIIEKKPFISESPVTDEMYSVTQPVGDKKGKWFNPSPEYMLDEFVKYAKAAGANGILKFKAQANYTYSPSKYGTTVHLNSYTLSGFAVKIE